MPPSPAGPERWRLTPCGLHAVVAGYGRALGVRLSPHRLRHTAITLALELTGGDVHGAQRLARMADVRTLMVYDHSRRDRQGQISRAISEAL